MLKARTALGKVWCGSEGCRGELPRPTPIETRNAHPDQIVFELDGWQLDDHGVERRIGRRRGNRAIRRARANTTAMLAGNKMKAWEVASVDGRRSKTLPFLAVCPIDDEHINEIDESLLV